jgi:hypothetical protein
VYQTWVPHQILFPLSPKPSVYLSQPWLQLTCSVCAHQVLWVSSGANQPPSQPGYHWITKLTSYLHEFLVSLSTPQPRLKGM